MKIGKQKKQKYLICFFLFISACLTRLYVLFTKPLWEDELWTYYFSGPQFSFFQQLFHPAEIRPPLFYLFMHVVQRINSSKIFMRFPGFLAGIIAIILIYKIIQKTNTYAARIIAFTMTFSLFLIDVSWQLRDYSFLVLTTTCIIILLYQIIVEVKQNHPLPLSLLLSLCGLFILNTLINYLSIPFMIAMLAMTIFVLTVSKLPHINIKEACKVLLILIPPLIISFLYFKNQITIIQTGTSWIPTPSLLSVLTLNSGTLGFVNNFDEIYSVDTPLLQKHIAINIMLFVTIMGSWLSIYKKKKSDPFFILLTIGYGTYIANIIEIIIGGKIVHSNLFLPRTFLSSILLFIISSALLFSLTIQQYVRKNKIPVITTLFAIAYLCIFTVKYSNCYGIYLFHSSPVDPTKEMVQKIYEKYTPNDQIIVFPLILNNVFFPLIRNITTPATYNVLSMGIKNAIDTSDILDAIRSIPAKHILFILRNENFTSNTTLERFKENPTNREKYRQVVEVYCQTKPETLLKNDQFTVESCKVVTTK